MFGSSHIWVDHNSLSYCADGLVDAVMGSTAITISNNHLAHHNEVMLLGHSDSYVRDKQMQVTIAYNHFGTGLIQRIPRCRHGYFHVVNNDYTHHGKCMPLVEVLPLPSTARETDTLPLPPSCQPLSKLTHQRFPHLPYLDGTHFPW